MIAHWRVDPYAQTSDDNSITALVNGNAIVGMARRRAILLWRLSVRAEPYRTAASCLDDVPVLPERHVARRESGRSQRGSAR